MILFFKLRRSFNITYRILILEVSDTKRYPFVKQKTSKDCAVASLSMIIRYYKGYIDNSYLTELTKTNKNGTTAFHLIEAAKQIGFESRGIKTKLEDLNKVVLPCIAHVTINKSYNHYIVIYEIDFKRKYLIVADPANKLKKISFKEFGEIWNEIIITLTPVEQIPIINNDLSIKKFCYNILSLNKSIFIKLLLLSLIITIFSVISSFSFKLMIDNITLGQTKYLIYIIFISFCILEIIKILINHYRNKLLIFLSQKIDWFLTNDIFNKIISLPYQYYRNHTTGDIVSRIGDLKTVKEVISRVVLTLFVDVPLTISSSIFLYFINSKLFFISICIFILFFFIITLFKPVYKYLINKIQKNSSKVNSYMIENISAFETIKGLGIEDEVNKNFKHKYYECSSHSLKLEKIYNLQNTLKSLINDIGTLTVIFGGSLLVLNNEISLGTLMAFNSLLGYFTLPIRNIIEFDTNLKEASNALSRILEILSKEKDEKYINHEAFNRVTYKNLTYSYDDINNVLNNINLTINNGEKIMILGSSGTGKSTLLKLLMKFYKVDRNKLFIDNIDINDYSIESIKNNICYISQNEMLFTNTLYNNLKLDRDVSDEKIEEVLDLCYIKDIFKNSNLGINTLIEENGFNLSGGEKQRIVLGRSLLKKFNILIIDEGLNQVDISLERKILKNILNKYKDKTIIVISHRLENIDLFNRVIKLNEGKIEQDMVKNGS